jgi:hypothetical protein
MGVKIRDTQLLELAWGDMVIGIRSELTLYGNNVLLFYS